MGLLVPLKLTRRIVQRWRWFMRFPFLKYLHRVCITKYGLEIRHLKLWLYCISQVKYLDSSQQQVQITGKDLNRRYIFPWDSTIAHSPCLLLFGDVKRHRAFLWVLKEPIHLDKLNHGKCFLLTWLLFVVWILCFHHLESWTFKQLSLITLEMAARQQWSDSNFSMEEHGLGLSGT